MTIQNSTTTKTTVSFAAGAIPYPFPDSYSSNSILSRFMHDVCKGFSHSSQIIDFSDAMQYLLQRRHRDLGPMFISISPAKLMRRSKFVPFEGLKNCGILLNFYIYQVSLYMPSSEQYHLKNHLNQYYNSC